MSRASVKEMERLFQQTVDALTSRLEGLEDTRTRAVGAGLARENVSHGARAVLDSLERGGDLPPAAPRRGRLGGAHSRLAPKNSAVRAPSYAAPAKRGAAARPPRFY